jgi:ribose transport system substrate-binding protein
MKLTRILVAFVLSATASWAAPAKIGVLLKDRTVFWLAAQKGAEAAAKDAGVELIVKAPLAPNSPAQQLAMLEALLKEPIDALVIAPLTEGSYKPQLTALAARGVKIVAMDTNLSGGLAQAYVGYNQVVMAEDAAKVFANLVGEGSGGVLRANTVDGQNVREKTLLAAFKSARPNTVLYTDVFAGGERDDDLPKSMLLLEKHPDVKAVCTLFSNTTLAMTKAIQSKNLAGKVQHVGFGTSLPDEVVAAIESGAMQAWIAQQPKLIGAKGVEAAAALLQGKSVPATVDVPYAIVTKDNLKSPEIQSIRN